MTSYKVRSIIISIVKRLPSFNSWKNYTILPTYIQIFTAVWDIMYLEIKYSSTFKIFSKNLLQVGFTSPFPPFIEFAKLLAIYCSYKDTKIPRKVRLGVGVFVVESNQLLYYSTLFYWACGPLITTLILGLCTVHTRICNLYQ